MSEDRRSPDGSNGTDGKSAPGHRLGDFELLQEIGRGGMGVVYEARQVSLNRRVALKVLPPGLGLTQEAVQRFEREARAAAKLHHTNIVPVHAIGEEQGNHFYAMELVEGLSLAQILSDVQQQGTELLEQEQTLTRLLTEAVGTAQPAEQTEPAEEVTSSDISTTGRAWFDTVAGQLADVAEALDYAHGRGVIHRDIKPGNLLLSGEGRLCITDFGLARVAQEPGMTTTGAMLGTPAYMSPEQARGTELDHRTDVYSLGVVLYEMLTLRRPFPGDSREKVVHAILTRDPVAPRRINRRVPLDLETICVKALEKNPDRRYRTAGEMAHDLRQYLARGLISARRAGPVERLGKLVRRHPLAATVVLAVVVVAAIGGYAWRTSMARTLEESKRAVADAQYLLTQGSSREALARTEEALSRNPNSAEARLLRARLLIDLRREDEAADEARRLLERDPEDWTAHLILAAVARGGGALGASIGEHLAVVEAKAPRTADALYLRSLAAQSHTDAIELLDQALDLYPAHAEALLARIGRRIGLKDYKAALQDCERLIVARPRSGVGRRMRATVNLELHDYRSALAEMDTVIEREPGEADNYALRGEAHSLLREGPEAEADLTRAIELRPDIAGHYLKRGQLRVSLGRHDEAAADFRETLKLDPDNLEAYGGLFRAQRGLDDDTAARETIEALRQQVARWTDPRDRAEAAARMAQLLQLLGDAEQALIEAERAVELDPGFFQYFVRAHARNHLGDVDGASADCDAGWRIELREPEALVSRAGTGTICARQELALADASRAVELAPGWPEAWEHLSMSHGNLGRREEAIADSERAIELAPLYSGAHNTRVYWASLMFRWEETLDSFTTLIELDPQNVYFHFNLAFPMSYLGRMEEALDTLNEAARLSPANFYNYWMRAGVLAHLGRCEEALADLQRNLELAPTQCLSHRESVMIQAVSFMPSCESFVDRQLLLQLGRRAVELAAPKELGGAKLALGMALYRNDRYEEARSELQEALSLQKKKLDAVSNELNMSSTHFFLAMTHWQLGQQEAARADYRRALARVEHVNAGKHPDSVWLTREAGALLGEPS